jgi:hypothetical protein
MYVEFLMFVLTPANGSWPVWFIYLAWCWLWFPEIGNSSFDWAQLSRLLPEDGDRAQSPKRCFNFKTGRFSMSKKSIIEKFWVVMRFRMVVLSFYGTILNSVIVFVT